MSVWWSESGDSFGRIYTHQKKNHFPYIPSLYRASYKLICPFYDFTMYGPCTSLQLFRDAHHGYMYFKSTAVQSILM